MNGLAVQLEAVRKAHANAVQATEAWGEYLTQSRETGEDRAKTARDALLAFLRIAVSAERELEELLAERNRAFEAATVLQAVIRWNGLERKIVVAKPNFRIDEPFIPEGFYRAIREKWNVPETDEIVTAEAYDIVVIDHFNRRIATIRSK